jgi:hypothetical protein
MKVKKLAFCTNQSRINSGHHLYRLDTCFSHREKIKFERLNLQSEVEAMLLFKEDSPNSMGVYSKILKLGLTVAAGGYRYTHSAFLGDSTEIYCYFAL